MPTVYLRKDFYDAIIRKREDPNSFVNKAVENMLKQTLPETKATSTKTTKSQRED